MIGLRIAASAHSATHAVCEIGDLGEAAGPAPVGQQRLSMRWSNDKHRPDVQVRHAMHLPYLAEVTTVPAWRGRFEKLSPAIARLAYHELQPRNDARYSIEQATDMNEPFGLSRRRMLQMTAAVAALSVKPLRWAIAAESTDPASAVPASDITSQLARYMVASREIALPTNVSVECKNHILDTFGAMVSGARMPAGLAALKFVREQEDRRRLLSLRRIFGPRLSTRHWRTQCLRTPMRLTTSNR